MPASAQLPQAQYRMIIVEGPDKGKRFALSKTKLTVGRGLDNEIVLNDPRSSREHVELEITPQGLKATNISLQNTMTINGSEVSEALMGPGAILLIGDTSLQFEISQVPQIAGPKAVTKNDSRFGVVSAAQDNFRPSRPEKNKVFYIIIGIVVLVGVLLFISDAKKKRQQAQLKTEEVIEQELQNSKMEVEKLLQDQIKQGKRSENYAEAQAAFIKGFRDFREGNYKRAISHFDAARALFPDHPTATRYRTLAVQKLDQLVQDTMREAKSAFERNQYQRALASYKQVKVLLNDPSNLTYKEADLAVKKLEILIQGAF